MEIKLNVLVTCGLCLRRQRVTFLLEAPCYLSVDAVLQGERTLT